MPGSTRFANTTKSKCFVFASLTTTPVVRNQLKSAERCRSVEKHDWRREHKAKLGRLRFRLQVRKVGDFHHHRWAKAHAPLLYSRGSARGLGGVTKEFNFDDVPRDENRVGTRVGRRRMAMPRQREKGPARADNQLSRLQVGRRRLRLIGIQVAGHHGHFRARAADRPCGTWSTRLRYIRRSGQLAAEPCPCLAASGP